MTGTRQACQSGAYFSMTASTPGFWSPMEFSIPPGVSVTRGVGFPIRGLSVVPLQQIAPSRWTSTTSPYSMPYPNVPEATIMGLPSTSPRSGTSSTVRSGSRAGCAGPSANSRAATSDADMASIRRRRGASTSGRGASDALRGRRSGRDGPLPEPPGRPPALAVVTTRFFDFTRPRSEAMPPARPSPSRTSTQGSPLSMPIPRSWPERSSAAARSRCRRGPWRKQRR